MRHSHYTVARSDGDNRECNLTLSEAAAAILSHDGGTWSIMADVETGGYRIWAAAPGAGGTLHATPWASPRRDIEAAKEEMFAKIVLASMDPDFKGLHAQLQKIYDAEIAKLEEE